MLNQVMVMANACLPLKIAYIIHGNKTIAGQSNGTCKEPRNFSMPFVSDECVPNIYNSTEPPHNSDVPLEKPQRCPSA